MRDLKLPFLEQRPYLHGTTLFDALIREYHPAPPLTFKISKTIETDMIRLVEAKPSVEMFATLAVANANIGVIPLQPSPAIERIGYDEKRISTSASINNGCIEFTGPYLASFVSTLIPLHKALLSSDPRLPSSMKWWFTRLDLTTLPSASEFPLQLRVQAILLSGRLVKSEIRVAGQVAGAIYFSAS